MLKIELHGEVLDLLSKRAIWWEKEQTLIISDLHWGKSGHFRKHGIAIPAQSQAKDELRLAQIISETKAERLVIAGDMFHSKINNEVEIFSHFRSSHQSLQIDLVIGNHDILGEEKYTDFRLSQHAECLTIGPFCIAHDMLQSDHFVIHGHVHPAVRIKARGNNQSALKLCCFAVQRDRLILPAFGEFTGTHVLEPQEFEHLYLVAENSVIQWK